MACWMVILQKFSAGLCKWILNYFILSYFILETLQVQQNPGLTGGMPQEVCALHMSWLAGTNIIGNLANVVGDCFIGRCDVVDIGTNVSCPCTCCATGFTPCCHSSDHSSNNCTIIWIYYSDIYTGKDLVFLQIVWRTVIQVQYKITTKTPK